MTATEGRHHVAEYQPSTGTFKVTIGGAYIGHARSYLEAEALASGARWPLAGAEETMLTTLYICPKGHPDIESNLNSNTNRGMRCRECERRYTCEHCKREARRPEGGALPRTVWIDSMEMAGRGLIQRGNPLDGGVYGLCLICEQGIMVIAGTTSWFTLERFKEAGGQVHIGKPRAIAEIAADAAYTQAISDGLGLFQRMQRARDAALRYASLQLASQLGRQVHSAWWESHIGTDCRMYEVTHRARQALCIACAGWIPFADGRPVKELPEEGPQGHCDNCIDIAKAKAEAAAAAEREAQ